MDLTDFISINLSGQMQDHVNNELRLHVSNIVKHTCVIAFKLAATIVLNL